MIEPNPEVLAMLKGNHAASKSQITYENIAIGEEGKFTLYWCKEDTGMASTTREHVEKHLTFPDLCFKSKKTGERTRSCFSQQTARST